jgi:glycosyltransferase involved in cell wall biosynthesis
MFYNSLLNSIVKKIEIKTIHLSNFVFAVGGLCRELNLSRNYLSVQNAVHASTVEYYYDHRKNIFNKINFVFVGKIMKHHNIKLLEEVLALIKNKKKIILHLIGNDINEKSLFSNVDIEVKYYGNIPHNDILPILKEMHVGILPESPKYSSNMKVFLYGAAKLLCLLPDIENMKSIFNEQEVMFFQRNNQADLSQKIDYIIEHPKDILSYGEKVYLKVKSEFTWEHIYDSTSEKIKQILNAEGSNNFLI